MSCALPVIHKFAGTGIDFTPFRQIVSTQRNYVRPWRRPSRYNICAPNEIRNDGRMLETGTRDHHQAFSPEIYYIIFFAEKIYTGKVLSIYIFKFFTYKSANKKKRSSLKLKLPMRGPGLVFMALMKASLVEVR